MNWEALQNNKEVKVCVCGIFTSTADTVEALLVPWMDVLDTFACVMQLLW